MVVAPVDTDDIVKVSKARDAEKEAKGKLIEFLNTSMTDVSKSSPTWPGSAALTPNGQFSLITIGTILLYCTSTVLYFSILCFTVM